LNGPIKSVVIIVFVHLNLVDDLVKKLLSRILAQIEIVTKLCDNLLWVIIFEHFDLFHIFSIKLDLQHTYRLFYHRELGVESARKGSGYSDRLWLLWRFHQSVSILVFFISTCLTLNWLRVRRGFFPLVLELSSIETRLGQILGPRQGNYLHRRAFWFIVTGFNLVLRLCLDPFLFLFL